VADPAEDHHDHQRPGLRPVEEPRAHEVALVGEQRAREAADGAGDDEAHQLVAVGREADRLHPRLVLADRLDDAPEARLDEPVHAVQRRGEDREHHVVEGDVVLEVQPEADLGARREVEPVLAAVGLHRDEDVVHHLREGERDHDEVHAAGAERDRADHEREERGEHDCHRPRDPRARDALGHQDPDRVRAGAEERGVAEAHHAAVAEDQVEARGRDRVDHDPRREPDVELPAEWRGGEREGDGGRRRGDRERVPHPRAGKRPCGFQNSTAAIST
jgi:hypothetical protein